MYYRAIKFDFVCLQKYDHETEEKAECAVPKVSRRLKSASF